VILAGTSGYAYPEWRGRFYPDRLAASRMLPFYAERFSTVEINASFYRLPTEATLGAWAAATPAPFVFALKAPRRITHDRRLADVDEPLRRFTDVAATLGAKLGPLLFQLPPRFRKETGRLAGLLAELPPGMRAAFEFRDESWLADDVFDLLRTRDAALCLADSERGRTPDVATASWGYLRLRDREYSDAELDDWLRTIARHGWRDAYVYFKHESAGTGPALAERLSTRVTATEAQECRPSPPNVST
jgi:uncharacterized protein YecE (DUF72 family)